VVARICNYSAEPYDYISAAAAATIMSQYIQTRGTDECIYGQFWWLLIESVLSCVNLHSTVRTYYSASEVHTDTTSTPFFAAPVAPVAPVALFITVFYDQ